jgi:AmmeMemoRadiSam system protein A
MDFSITDNEKEILLRTARESIASKLAKRTPSFPKPTETLMTNCGAFVTLHKKGQLRGCIGYIVGTKPLIDTIREMALSSAFHDPRFSPVERNEYDSLEIEISVLSPLRRITNVDEIRVGEHGIIIKRGYNSGLLLPQVATEYGWDRDTFLKHTCHKAGLPPDAWKDPASVIEIFSAIVFSEKTQSIVPAPIE